VPVRDTLKKLVDGLGDAERTDAQLWLARTEVFLDWVAQHPHLFELNCEAARLLSMYQGTTVHSAPVDYRGVIAKPKEAAAAHA